jgi:hypothetical protein
VIGILFATFLLSGASTLSQYTKEGPKMPDLQQQNYPTQERYSTPAMERVPGRTEPSVQRQAQVVTGGSALEAVAGIAAIVLAIIALSTTGTFAFYMTAIGTIVLGAGLVLYGSSVAVRVASATPVVESFDEDTVLGVGVTAEVLGGLAGIVLGILALCNLVPELLLAAAMIVFGGTLIFSSGTVSEVNEIGRPPVSDTVRQLTRRATVGAAGIQLLTGIAGVVLGILAVIGYRPWTLTQVAILCIGGGLLLAGGAVATRLMAFLGRRAW